MKNLKQWTSLALVGSLGVGMFGATGCETMNEHRMATGAVVGTVVGAAAGAAIDSDNRGRGALIGAAAGAAVGTGVGYLLQKQKQAFDRIEELEARETTVVYAPPPPAAAEGAPPPPPSKPIECKALTLRLQSDVLFPIGSSALSAHGAGKVAEIAEVLKEYPESNVVVRGYTSSDGDDKSNYELSVRRAEVIRSQLIANGIARSRIQALGMGESSPVADNNTEAGRVLNRRVEIDVIPHDQSNG